MTVVMLTRTLDAELEALLAGESTECLVCGEHVEAEGGRVECAACGSVLRRLRPEIEGQLALV